MVAGTPRGCYLATVDITITVVLNCLLATPLLIRSARYLDPWQSQVSQPDQSE
jgi:hypothetical protein